MSQPIPENAVVQARSAHARDNSFDTFLERLLVPYSRCQAGAEGAGRLRRALCSKRRSRLQLQEDGLGVFSKKYFHRWPTNGAERVE